MKTKREELSDKERLDFIFDRTDFWIPVGHLNTGVIKTEILYVVRGRKSLDAAIHASRKPR